MSMSIEKNRMHEILDQMGAVVEARLGKQAAAGPELGRSDGARPSRTTRAAVEPL